MEACPPLAQGLPARPRPQLPRRRLGRPPSTCPTRWAAGWYSSRRAGWMAAPRADLRANLNLPSDLHGRLGDQYLHADRHVAAARHGSGSPTSARLRMIPTILPRRPRRSSAYDRTRTSSWHDRGGAHRCRCQSARLHDFSWGRTGWELQRAVIIHAIIYVSNARIGELPVPRSASQRGVCEESMMTLSVPAAIL